MDVRYDPRAPEVLADPYPVFQRLQLEDPVHWSEILDGWVLTRYAHVRPALQDVRLSSLQVGRFMERLPAQSRERLAQLGQWSSRFMNFCDPPEHTRLRALVMRSFTPQAVERLRPRIEALVDQLLGEVADRGEADLMRALARPLPLGVIAEMFGLPAGERPRFHEWSDEAALFTGNWLTTPDRHTRAQRAMCEMAARLTDLIEERRAHPAADLLSALAAALDRGEVSMEDVVATAIVTVGAGHETTINLIGNGVLALLRHPEQAQALRRDPSLLPSAIEEMLRYDAPVQAVGRVAQEDLEIGGTRIRRGERVYCMLGAANRDPARFEKPDRFDIMRRDNQHLAFGQATHFCVGAPLARLEGQIAIGALLRRMPDLHLKSGALSWTPSLTFRGVSALPVAWDRGPSQ